MDRWRHGEVAEAAAAGRTSCADSEVDSEVDSAGASPGHRPAATTATAVLAALRGKKILHISQDFFLPRKNLCLAKNIVKKY